jgi:uncharacterized protein (TIGR02284 family)
MNNNGVISILENLIETCKAGQNVFRQAAETIQNSEYRRLFNIFSQQRAQFITELQAEAHRLGGRVNEQFKYVAPPTNKTIPFRTPLIRDEASIVADCQFEEEIAVNDYQAALKEDLPLDIQYVVKRQYMDIRDAYDRIRILRRAA